MTNEHKPTLTISIQEVDNTINEDEKINPESNSTSDQKDNNESKGLSPEPILEVIITPKSDKPKSLVPPPLIRTKKRYREDKSWVSAETQKCRKEMTENCGSDEAVKTKKPLKFK